jgi:hypothetical protein
MGVVAIGHVLGSDLLIICGLPALASFLTTPGIT